MLKVIYHRLHGFMPSACAGCQQASTTPLCADCLAAVKQVELACRQCGKQLFEQNEQQRCHDCIKSPPAFDAFYSIGVYQGVLQELIINAKVKRQAAAIAALYYLIDNNIEAFPAPTTSTYLQAMPTPQSRLIQRGFNLPQLLANRVRKKQHCQQLKPIDLVKLPFFTKKQASMNLQQRRYYHHPFALKKSIFLNKNTKIPQHIILFDDILTTGISAHQLAYLLKSKGVKSVTVWAISRAQLK